MLKTAAQTGYGLLNSLEMEPRWNNSPGQGVKAPGLLLQCLHPCSCQGSSAHDNMESFRAESSPG